MINNTIRSEFESQNMRQQIMPEEQFKDDYSMTECLNVNQRIQYLSWQYSVPTEEIMERCIDLGLPHCEEKKPENKVVVFVKSLFKNNKFR